MRISALSVAILAFATVTTNLSLADDFSALLADLSFGDVPSIDQPLSVAETAAPEELKQIEQLNTVAKSIPTPANSFQMPGMLESETDVVATPKIQDPAPQVALQDPVPASTPKPVAEFDLDAAFALQDVQPVRSQVPSQTVGHHLDRCDEPNCDSQFTCRPHVRPALPSSTLYQYFRSDPCYSNVWDGYRRSCKHHKHLHGECDCFDKSSKSHCWSSLLGCERNDCDSCDTGCDR